MAPTARRTTHRIATLSARLGLVALTLISITLTMRSPAAAQPQQPFDWSDMQDWTWKDHTVRSCGGEGPFACIYSDGGFVGTIELFSAPVSSFPILDGVDDPKRAIRLIGEDFLTSFSQDRAEGCPSYRFTAKRPHAARVAGTVGASWGFSLSIDGDVTERSLLYGAVDDGTVYLVVANADSGHACVPAETGLTVDSLEDFDDAFRILAANSVFPDEQT